MSIQVTLFQLLQWKHAIALEAKGIKVTRRSVRTFVARKFGLGGRTPHAEVLKHVEAALDAVKRVGARLTDVVSLSPS